MPLAYNTGNYMWGKGRLYFEKDNTTGLLDLGNCPEFALNIEVTKDDHYSSRSGARTKDLSPVTEKMCTGSITLEEFSPENIDLAFFGDGVISGSQLAGTIDAVSTTTVDDRYVDLGKTDLYYTKISHGTVTDGPFVVGDTVSDATTGTTATVAWVGTGFVEVVDIGGTGAFTVGNNLTGPGTPTETAAITGVETMNGAVVTNLAAATTRYVAGTDYDVDYVGGLLRERSTGAIAANTCFVSADYSAKTQTTVRPFVNSSTTGELLFIGDPDDGPRYRINAWSCEITPAGALALISENMSEISIEIEVLNDSTNHPNDPWIRVREDS